MRPESIYRDVHHEPGIDEVFDLCKVSTALPGSQPKPGSQEEDKAGGSTAVHLSNISALSTFRSLTPPSASAAFPSCFSSVAEASVAPVASAGGGDDASAAVPFPLAKKRSTKNNKTNKPKTRNKKHIMLWEKEEGQPLASPCRHSISSWQHAYRGLE